MGHPGYETMFVGLQILSVLSYFKGDKTPAGRKEALKGHPEGTLCKPCEDGSPNL